MEAQQPKEGVRAWFQRTTSKSKKICAIASGCSGVLMAAMWIFAPTATLAKIQTFNGALTVPLFGGLWIYMFIYGFLIPSREASFRAQESLESGLELLTGAAKIWERVGLQVEKEFPLMLQKINTAVDDLRNTAKSIQAAVEKNESFLQDAKPALDSLKAIEVRIEHEMKAGIVEDFRMAIDSVKMMMPPPVKNSGKVAIPETTPDLSTALKLIGKKKPESSPVQVKV